MSKMRKQNRSQMSTPPISNRAIRAIPVTVVQSLRFFWSDEPKNRGPCTTLITVVQTDRPTPAARPTRSPKNVSFKPVQAESKTIKTQKKKSQKIKGGF